MKVRDSSLLKINILTFVLVFLSIGANMGLHKMADLPVAIVSEACFNGVNARPINWPAKTWSILTLLIFQVRILIIKLGHSHNTHWSNFKITSYLFECPLY